MAETACLRAWAEEGWGPYHQKLLTMCIKIENPGRRKYVNTSQYQIERHLDKAGSISIREAMDDYNVSGGHLTKIICRLKERGMNIVTQFQKHPITGRRYARYFLLEDGCEA